MENNNKTVNVRVEFEPRQIRHIAIQCPECKNWFYGNDICRDFLHEEYQIHYNSYTCPICSCHFGDSHDITSDLDEYTYNIEQVSYPDLYKDCKKKKIIWE